MSIMPMQPSPTLPRCKVCDVGYLERRKIYRLSGPVVVIGYLLLIPSILGIVVSAILMFAALTYGQQSSLSDPDHDLRIQCFNETKAAMTTMANGVEPLPSDYPNIDTYCECLLPAARKGQPTGIGSLAAASCSRLIASGSLTSADAATQRLYDEQDYSTSDTFLRTAGSGIAVIGGIAAFISGLLGWLLVMRKRVLRCNMCGSTVSAS